MSQLRGSGICRQLSLLLWKNWIIKKTKWVDTLLEILAPVFLALVIVGIRSAIAITQINESTYHLPSYISFLSIVYSLRFCVGFLSSPVLRGRWSGPDSWLHSQFANLFDGCPAGQLQLAAHLWYSSSPPSQSMFIFSVLCFQARRATFLPR
jgi:flagellar biosynthesis protein FliQ